MDFRVTHFLVADSVSSATLATVADKTLTAVTADGTSKSLSSLSSGTAGTPGITGPYQFAQGLNRTDAIEKELGVIKSGIIDSSKILSVRKLVGTDDYSRSIKSFGSAVSYSSTAPSALPATTGTVTKGVYYHTTHATTGVISLLFCTTAGTVVYANQGVIDTAVATGIAGGNAEFVIGGGAKFMYEGTLSASTVRTGKMVYTAPNSTKVSGLQFEADKEYTFSVRVRSAKANSISPFGITRGYSATASNVYLNPNTGTALTAGTGASVFSSFSTLFNITKNFSNDQMLTDFARVYGFLQMGDSDGSSGAATITKVFVFVNYDLLNTVSGKIGYSTTIGDMPSSIQNSYAGTTYIVDVRKYQTWGEVLADTGAITTVPAVTEGAGFNASLIVEALEQTTWKNNYDITAFPYKWDYVRLNGYFYEGPYGALTSFVDASNNVLPINAGVSTQTPITYDATQSGLIAVATIAINESFAGSGGSILTAPGFLIYDTINTRANLDIKFPNLMKEEVRHIAHQYQSYSNKYKQQFRGVRYNAMLMDPQQEKITANGPYTLYYIEYLPSVDTSYTSTQQMTNLTIIATANSTVATQLDYALYGATFASSTDGKYVLETAS
jgi:hypothetical protein